MKNIGVICEYNPFHNGHLKQLNIMKSQGNAICVMSGQFVQRGEPAIFDKEIRTRAALDAGADLVLELPITRAIASAEQFARGGVEVLNKMGCVDTLCFGVEKGTKSDFQELAAILSSEPFAQHLHTYINEGFSFPKARQLAVKAMGLDDSLLEDPNNILAIEYCKAISELETSMDILPVIREGSYHTSEDPLNPSATFLRTANDWNGFVPEYAELLYTRAVKHTLQLGEKAVLARLRSMSSADFAALPYGNEGLWVKFMDNARSKACLEEIIAGTKSKRYTRTRISRMMLCACLGITEKMLSEPVPYVRVLGMNDVGASIIKEARNVGKIHLINEGENVKNSEYYELEQQAQRMYELFSDSVQETGNRRIVYRRGSNNS